jgi:hypothetical protein
MARRKDQKRVYLAGERGEPREVFLRSYADDESIAFRGWRIGEGTGRYRLGGIRHEAAIFLTSEGSIVVCLREQIIDPDPEEAAYEGEYTFVEKFEDVAAAENFLFQNTSDTEAAQEAWDQANMIIGGDT